MTKKINLNELQKMLKENDSSVQLVDVLDESQYNKEHIKGAISLPVDKIEDQAHEKLNKDDKIIVYCASAECQASPKAAEKLVSMGFKNVYDFEDGLKGYKAANLPLDGGLDIEA